MACIAKRRGRYVIDFYDTYGKRRWITMPKGTTKKKAKEKFREVEDQLRRGIYLPDKKIPNFKQVAKDWIEHKKPNLRHSTWSVYEGHTRNHFDDFDPIKINRITTAKVEKWISSRHNGQIRTDASVAAPGRRANRPVPAAARIPQVSWLPCG